MTVWNANPAHLGRALRQPLADLNAQVIATDGTVGEPLADWGAVSTDGQTRVVFKDLERTLLAFLGEAPVVVGCVAWLTHPAILATLAQCEAVALVVQKEDFLRPDLASGNRHTWATRLRTAYEALPGRLSRYTVGGRLRGMSGCCDPAIAAVRCVGNYNQERLPAFPRMHNKFVVACRFVPGPPNAAAWAAGLEDLWPVEAPEELVPYAVWTGSFNFTATACRSFENALISTDPALVAAYYAQWSQIAALSEPLDWQSIWVAPEWRIGT
jgi:hypothetical protein